MMSAKSVSGLPVGFTCMPSIMVFIVAAKALSAGLAAGFAVMPFMSSAPTVCAVERNADRTRAARKMDLFIVISFQRERRSLRLSGGQQYQPLNRLAPDSTVGA